MKKLILFLLPIALSNVYAQDRVIIKNGEFFLFGYKKGRSLKLGQSRQDIFNDYKLKFRITQR